MSWKDNAVLPHGLGCRGKTTPKDNVETKKILFFKIVSIVSIVFKTTQESRLCSSPLSHAILAAKVLKTIETIETIFCFDKTFFLLLKKQRSLLKSFKFCCWKTLILLLKSPNFMQNCVYRFVSFNHALLTLWKGLFELLIKPIWGAH